MKKKKSLLICVVLFSWHVGNLFFSNKFCQSYLLNIKNTLAWYILLLGFSCGKNTRVHQNENTWECSKFLTEIISIFQINLSFKLTVSRKKISPSIVTDRGRLIRASLEKIKFFKLKNNFIFPFHFIDISYLHKNLSRTSHKVPFS